MSDTISQDIAISGEGNIVVGKGDVIIAPLPAAEARLRRDLGILLKNVETTWITGVLEKSVHEAALLELGMELREDVIDNPWRMVVEGPGQAREELPRGRNIKDIFDEANRLLLILGEPGSGKTTTLLQLARDLMADVDPAFTHPVPVILNLSSWTDKQQPLEKWLVAELSSKYRLPQRDGQAFLQDHRLSPLLDGLDEVRPENRAACIEKINRLVKDYGLQGLVVCSRIKDYTELDTRLQFYRAIYIQPLSPEQVDQYLQVAGEKLASLRAALQADADLRSMAQSPLILNIMSLAYQDASAEALRQPSLTTDEARRQRLFDAYIARMLSRKGGSQEYTAEQTKDWLSWLALNIQRRNKDVFLIEDLQPSWLSTPGAQRAYVLVSRLLNGFVVSAVYLALGAGVLPTLWYPGLPRFWGPSVVAAALIGVALAVVDMMRLGLLGGKRAPGGRSTFWSTVGSVLTVGFTGGLIFALAVSITLLLTAGLYHTGIEAGNGDWLGFRLMIDHAGEFLADPTFILFSVNENVIPGGMLGLAFGLIFGLIFGIRASHESLEQDIQTVEALHWFWSKALRGALLGAAGGFVVGLLLEPLALFENWTPGDPLPTFNAGEFWGGILVLVMPFGAHLGLVLAGLQRMIIETKSRPNQGIRLSLRNAVIGGLAVALVTGFFAGSLSILMGRVPRDLMDIRNILSTALAVGSIFGFMGALWYGAVDVTRHYVLRAALVRHGHTPAKYARFLDYAAERIFLQKVGGGYRFVHRLLLEHFAGLSERERTEAS